MLILFTIYVDINTKIIISYKCHLRKGEGASSLKYMKPFINLIKISLSIIACIILIAFPIITLYFISSSYKNGDYVAMPTGWTVSVNDEKYEDIDLTSYIDNHLNRGDIVTLEKELPKYDFISPILVLYVKYSSITVFLDGSEIHNYGRDRYAVNKITGKGYIYLSLPENMSGHTLAIQICIGMDNAFSTIKSPIICDEASYRNFYTSKNIANLSMAFYFILFGISILAIAILFIVKKNAMISNISKLIWMGAFCTNCGLWVMCSGELTEIFTSDIIYKVYIEYISFYALPIFFLCYNADGNETSPIKIRRYLFRILAIVTLLFWLVALCLQTTHTYSFPQLLIVGQILDLLTLCYVLSVNIYDLTMKVDRSYFSLFGTLFVTCIAIFYIFFYNTLKFVSPFGITDFNMTNLYISVVIFIAFLFIDYINDTIISTKSKVKLDTVEKLAYTDALTSLANRQATEIYFDTIDKGEIDYAIIEFDLDGLKKVNDTLGHSMGDKYISSFANILKDNAHDNFFVARIGGDEFISVIPKRRDDDDLESIGKEYLRKIDKSIENTNIESKMMKFSTSYGLCTSFEDGVENIRQALKQADIRMYEHKKSRKKERKD